MMVFFAVIGASANVAVVLRQGPVLFVFAAGFCIIGGQLTLNATDAAGYGNFFLIVNYFENIFIRCHRPVCDQAAVDRNGAQHGSFISLDAVAKGCLKVFFIITGKSFIHGI